MSKKKALILVVCIIIFAGLSIFLILNNTLGTSSLLKPGAAAPNWRLQGEHGPQSLTDYRNKLLVIDFWATWCIPCVQSMPKLDNLYRKYADSGLEVIGISAQEKEGADPVSFARKWGVSYDILVMGDSVLQAYGVTGFPALFLVDWEGKIVFAKQGLNNETYQQVEAHIIDLLKKEPSSEIEKTK